MAQWYALLTCNRESVVQVCLPVRKLLVNAFYPQFEDKFPDFYKKIKAFNITTATLQQYLFGYMDEDSYEVLNENIHELEELSKIHKYDDMNLNIYS